jgi:hypothetical protein
MIWDMAIDRGNTALPCSPDREGPTPGCCHGPVPVELQAFEVKWTQNSL